MHQSLLNSIINFKELHSGGDPLIDILRDFPDARVITDPIINRENRVVGVVCMTRSEKTIKFLKNRSKFDEKSRNLSNLFDKTKAFVTKVQ